MTTTADKDDVDLGVYRRSWDSFIDAYAELLAERDALKQTNVAAANLDDAIEIIQQMVPRLMKSKAKKDQEMVGKVQKWLKSAQAPVSL